MVLDFNPVDDCPLWLALINNAMDKSGVNIYNQWLWLTPDDILALQYHPDPNKQKIVPLSWGYHTHVTRFKAMYSELQLNPGWTDLDIFKITYDEYMGFSRPYMAGQVASNPWSMAPNSNTSSTDLIALFTKSIVESKEKVAPKGIVDKDIGGDDAITAKGIKEIPSISSRLVAIPTTVLPSEGDTNGVLNIIGNAAQGIFKSAENFRHPSPTSVLSLMMFAVDPPLSSFHCGHQVFSTVKLKACPHGEPGTNMNSCPSLNVRNMAAYADSGKAIAPKGIKCHMSTASKSMDTGKPHSSSIIVSHNVSSIPCDPSSHSVIPITSQDHGESFMECRLQNHTDSSDPEMTDQDPFFIASFLEACILFDTGGDVATVPTCNIKNVCAHTADDHLLVSRDSEMTTDEEILHICPSLIHFVVTLEQQFITIDDLLTEEAVDMFMDNAMDPFNQSASSARDTRNSMPFAPLWIIFSVMCAPPCDFSGSWGDFQRSNDDYSIDPLVLEPQDGSACISAKVDIQVLMCLLARLLIGLSICNGSLIVACDDHPLLSMHHVGHQSFPSVKYKQIQHNGTTSSFEPSADYDTVNVINLEWIC
jgi:hypothetical protein